VIHQVNDYSAWMAASGDSVAAAFPRIRDRAHLRETGLLQVAEVDTCIKMIRDYVKDVPLTHYYSWTLPPGLPPRWAETHLKLFVEKVIPAFR